MMTQARSGWALAAGLILAAAPAPPAAAQAVPIFPAEPVPAGPVAFPAPLVLGSTPVPPPGFARPTAAAAHVAPGSGAPAAVPPPPVCTCGDRRGLSRRRWHRAHCGGASCIGRPEEFNEWPLGWSAYAHARAQVANGAAAQMVFYDYDFVPGTGRLNLAGRDKLARVAARLPATFAPVIVERTPEAPGLDAARKAALVADLAGGPFPIPPERILIGPPPAAGFNGQEAGLVYRNLLGQTAAGGIGGSVAAPVAGSGLDASGLTSGVVGGIR